jgi:hypothetical protein
MRQFAVKTDQLTSAARRVSSAHEMFAKIVTRYATTKILIEIRVVAKSVESEDPVFTSMGVILNGP